MHYVYMIYSATADVYYKGYTTNPTRRLEQHNNKESDYTSNRGPWVLVFVQEYETESAAKKREKQLKRQHRKYLLWVIEQDYNLIDSYAGGSVD